MSFQPRDYVPVPSLSTLINVPRFGHSRDFARVAISQDDAISYFRGVVGIPGIIFLFFAIWAIAILVFMCLGRRRVGYLSGQPFVRPAYNDNYMAPFICRIFFLLGAAIVIIFTILMFTHGFTNLGDTANTIVDTAASVTSLATQLRDLSGNISQVTNETKSTQREILMQLEGPLGSCLEGDVGNLTNITLPTTNQQLAEAVRSVRTDLQSFENDAIPDELGQLYDATNTTIQYASDVDAGSEHVGNYRDWQIFLALIPYLLLPFLLMLGVLFATCGAKLPPCVKCLMSWLLLPLFCLKILFSCVIGAVLMNITIANADFCAGNNTAAFSPDSTIKNLLLNANVDPNELFFRSVTYYVDQCRGSVFPFEFLNEFSNDIQTIGGQVSNFTTTLESSSDPALLAVCGEAQVARLVELTQTVNQNLVTLANDTQRIVELANCESISPTLYVAPVYDGACTTNLTGMTWIFASLLAVAFGGMLMIMLRSSWQGVEEEDNDEYETAISNQSRDGYDDEPEAPKSYNGIADSESQPTNKAYAEVY